MTDDPGFRRETHSTVEPTPQEQIDRLRAEVERLTFDLDVCEKVCESHLAKLREMIQPLEGSEG